LNPGEIVPLNVISWPGFAGFGDADPAAVGGVGSVLKVATTLTLSIARPSSEPDVSVSVHLIQSEEPGFKVRPAMVPLIDVRQAAEFPSVAVARDAQAFPSDGKLSEERLLKLPVVRFEAVVL
jgi:hypothetical protein